MRSTSPALAISTSIGVRVVPTIASRSGIAKGGSPFSTPERLTVDGQEVFRVEGLGDTHFFYQSSLKQEEVVWLTIKSVNPVVILEEALKLF